MTVPQYELLTVKMMAEAANTLPSFKSDGTERVIRALRDGSLTVADWVFAMAIAGYGHVASVGTATTPITFKTGFTAAQPEIAIDVPAGTTIVPLHILVSLEDSAGTDNEIVFETANNAVGAGTSTAITSRNLINGSNTGLPTGCSIYSAYSGNGTAPTSTVEFWRHVYPFADATKDPVKSFEWSFDRHAPVIVAGAGSLVGYVGGTTTAPAGYIKVAWIELPTAYLL